MATDKQTPEEEEMMASFHAGQAPADPGLAKRLWRQWAEGVITVAVLGVYLVCMLLFKFLGDIEDNQKAAEERGYKNRAVNCQQLFTDDDRIAPITDDCTEPAVLKYFPQEICLQMGVSIRGGCGSAFQPSPYSDPLLSPNP